MIRFTSLAYSPWSEKARWALDHHHVPYQKEDYAPLLGEVKLRLRLRKFSGRVTVPVLYADGVWLTDSFEIARYADQRGSGSRLFPAAHLAAITDWNARSEAALAAGRALLMLTMTRTPERAINFLPFPVPQAAKPLLLPVAKQALAAFIAKYHMRDGASEHEAVLHRELDGLQRALSGRRYLLGDALSYADIAMAVVANGIRPVDEKYTARLPGMDDNAYNSTLQQRYADLLAWRDELYERHRRA